MSDDRLSHLRHHYRNERLYNERLRAALERIFREPSRARTLASEALDTPRPPQPLVHLYDQGMHTGHPYDEYLELPMRAYLPCETCGGTTNEACQEASAKARAKP